MSTRTADAGGVVPADQVLLVASVGGHPRALSASLAHWMPARATFVITEAEASAIEGNVLGPARQAGIPLDSGRWNLVTIPAAHDLRVCIARLRPLTSEVEEWLARGVDHRVVVDFTGGSRCMTAALALHARRWPCAFSYEAIADAAGGDGHPDQVVQRYNPWDTLGYQAIEDACELFNRGHYAAATEALRTFRKRADDPAVRRELSTLEAVTGAYAAWDRFEHGAAATGLANAVKNGNDLRVILGVDDGDRLITLIESHRQMLASAVDPVRDLIANAMRRAGAERYDDAVARLYRAVEALAQAALLQYGFESARVPVDSLPEPLATDWKHRADAEGTCAIGLQDAYRLLHALGDDLGRRFLDSVLCGAQSPLSSRNQSILAHGFQPVSKTTYEMLLSATLALGDLTHQDLPTFPRLELLPPTLDDEHLPSRRPGLGHQVSS